MKYKLKPIKITADSVDTLQIPDAMDRVILKTGSVIEFSMKDIEDNIKYHENLKLEISARIKLDKSKVENIESFHKFVKEMSDQDLHTCWMYFESKTNIKGLEKKLAEVEEQLESDIKEKAEIIKQIPDVYGAKD